MVAGTPSRGGAALFDKATEGPLAESREAIADRGSSLAEPEQQMMRMIGLTYAAVLADRLTAMAWLIFWNGWTAQRCGQRLKWRKRSG